MSMTPLGSVLVVDVDAAADDDDDDDLTLFATDASTGKGTLGTRSGLEFTSGPLRNDGVTLFAFPGDENRCVNSFFLRSTSANITSMLLLTLLLLLLLLLGATSKEFPVLLGKGAISLVVVVCRKKNPISRITNAARNTAVAFSWLNGDGVRLSLSVSSLSSSTSVTATANRLDFFTFVLRMVDDRFLR